MKRAVCLAAALSSSVVTATAQSPQPPKFDVTSVKRNTAGGPMRMLNAPGYYNATNIPVMQLIRMAYQLQDFQIVGAPSWANSDRFDIEAKFDVATISPPAPGQPSPMFQMMRGLLRDRFGLMAHTETRELPMLALKVARADGRLGPQMKPAAADCSPQAGPRGGGPIAGRGGPPPGAPFSPGQRPQCGDLMGFGQLLAGGIPMSRLTNQILAPLTGRLVVDRTGLTGAYDIDLKWTPTPNQLPPGPPPPGVELPAIDPNGPSLEAALQEQLGLKLDAERGPVDVLVIEKIVPPTEN